MTISSNAPDTTPQAAPEVGAAPADTAERIIADALARDRDSVLSPRGAERARALAALRAFVETFAADGEQAARAVLSNIPAEPRGDAPAVAHVVGVAMSTLDDWFTGNDSGRAPAVVPIGAWSNRPARRIASDALGLARRGRAFGALDGLRRRYDGPTILEGAALAAATTVTVWAARDAVDLDALLAELLPGTAPIALDAPATDASDGSSFRRPQGAAAGAVGAQRSSVDDAELGFGAWLKLQTSIAAPSVAVELELFGALRELARTRELDLGLAAHVAAFVSTLQETADPERPQALHNALAMLRDYTHFRLALGADAASWQWARGAISDALGGGRLAFATVARVLADEEDFTASERRDALSRLPLIARVDALLEWIGRSKEVTESGALRPGDAVLLAETLGVEQSAAQSAGLVQAWWTALSHAGIVETETTAQRARRGAQAGDWLMGEPLPLDLAVRVVSIFVAETVALADTSVNAVDGELRTTEALSGLLRVLSAQRDSGAGPEHDAVRELDGQALQALAAVGLVASDADGLWSVPAVLQGAVARGILLATELLAAGAEPANEAG